MWDWADSKAYLHYEISSDKYLELDYSAWYQTK